MFKRSLQRKILPFGQWSGNMLILGPSCRCRLLFEVHSGKMCFLSYTRYSINLKELFVDELIWSYAKLPSSRGQMEVNFLIHQHSKQRCNTTIMQDHKPDQERKKAPTALSTTMNGFRTASKQVNSGLAIPPMWLKMYADFISKNVK